MKKYQVKKAVLTFISGESFHKRDAEKLRGYFGNLYREEDLFHNHNGNEGFFYRMPLIQYRVIEGRLTIAAFNEGVPVLSDKFLQVSKIILGDRVVFGFETSLAIKDEAFCVADELYSYYFDSPWLPINQKNHDDYLKGKLDLNRTLQNHLLSNFKGLGIHVEDKIMVKGSFREKKVNQKNASLIGFSGSFTCNVMIPDLMGVGKMKAVGFGCVRGEET